MIVISLATATICFLGNCYPALIGDDTPTGEYQLTQRITMHPGYGGDVLQFKETPKSWYAIHRVWLLNPKQKRVERLKSGNAADRNITNGCVNVDPAVYELLKDCCSNDRVLITK